MNKGKRSKAGKSGMQDLPRSEVVATEGERVRGGTRRGLEDKMKDLEDQGRLDNFGVQDLS
jgi:hypothetical protein